MHTRCSTKCPLAEIHSKEKKKSLDALQVSMISRKILRHQHNFPIKSKQSKCWRFKFKTTEVGDGFDAQYDMQIMVWSAKAQRSVLTGIKSMQVYEWLKKKNVKNKKKKIFDGVVKESLGGTSELDWSSLNKVFSKNKNESVSFGSKHWASVYLVSTPQQAAAMGLEFPGVNEVEESEEIDASLADPFLADAIENVWGRKQTIGDEIFARLLLFVGDFDEETLVSYSSLEVESEKHERTVKACVLIKDFELFSNGDLTEIGERGINISGGQKLMYVAVDAYPCVRLLNFSGETGCSNPGLNKVVAPIIKLKDIKDLLQPHTILVTTAVIEDLFTRVTSDLSLASKIGGLSSNNRKPVVLTVASMDSASFFRDKIFGADSPISSLVALLGAVDGFGNLKKQLVYLVLTGETWGYLGSKRFLYELDLHSDVVAKYIGNQTALQAFHEMTQSRHKNLNLQKEKRSLASKSWRFKYKYHNDMANRLVIEAIQEIESSGDNIVIYAKLIPQHASVPIEAFSHFKVLDSFLEPSLRFYSEPLIFFEAWSSEIVRTNWVHSQPGFEWVKTKNNTHQQSDGLFFG